MLTKLRPMLSLPSQHTVLVAVSGTYRMNLVVVRRHGGTIRSIVPQTENPIRHDIPNSICRASNTHEQDNVSKKDRIADIPRYNDCDEEYERDENDTDISVMS